MPSCIYNYICKLLYVYFRVYFSSFDYLEMKQQFINEWSNSGNGIKFIIFVKIYEIERYKI